MFDWPKLRDPGDAAACWTSSLPRGDSGALERCWEVLRRAGKVVDETNLFSLSIPLTQTRLRYTLAASKVLLEHRLTHRRRDTCTLAGTKLLKNPALLFKDPRFALYSLGHNELPSISGTRG